MFCFLAGEFTLPLIFTVAIGFGHQRYRYSRSHDKYDDADHDDGYDNGHDNDHDADHDVDHDADHDDGHDDGDDDDRIL